MAVAVATVGGPDRNTASQDIVITKPTGTAVGDLLLAHMARQDNDQTSRTWSGPAGWTSAVDVQGNDTGASSSGLAVFWKVATSTETAASNFTFSVGTASDTLAGAMYRITGAHGTTPVSASSSGFVNNDETPTFTVTITPHANSMIFLMVHHYAGGSTSKTTSGYAIVTSDPTWTEGYDNHNSTSLTLAGAYGLRAAATATGDATFTSSGDATTDCGLGIVAIRPPIDVTVSPSEVTATSTVQTPTISGGATVEPSTVTGTSTVNTPVTMGQADWSAQGKSTAPTWTSQTKS